MLLIGVLTAAGFELEAAAELALKRVMTGKTNFQLAPGVLLVLDASVGVVVGSSDIPDMQESL